MLFIGYNDRFAVFYSLYNEYYSRGEEMTIRLCKLLLVVVSIMLIALSLPHKAAGQ